MKFFRSFALAGATFAMLIAGTAPTPVIADGAASTRNLLLLGGAAATYLVIEHNRKVHEREAQAAAREAAAAEQRNDAWAAYHQAERAYQAEAQEVIALKKELARTGAAPSSNGSMGWGTL